MQIDNGGRWEVAFRVHRTLQEASLECICEIRVLPAFRGLSVELNPWSKAKEEECFVCWDP